jgi:hypothetical protein
MLEKVQALADVMVATSPNLRIAFNEADTTAALELEAQHFLKANNSRLGRDFKLYAFMAKIGGEQDVTVRLLEELVLPLQEAAPAAYIAGLSYLREQGSIFGENKNKWESMIDGFKPKAP